MIALFFAASALLWISCGINPIDSSDLAKSVPDATAPEVR